MPITVDWGTLVISVPISYLTFISGTLWELDTDQFRLDLKGLEAGASNRSAPGMAHLDTHDHNTTYTVAGVTYGRKVEIINGYTVTFEDGQYAVRLVGSNNNIFDEGVINRNQVSVISTNSAGLIVVQGGAGGTGSPYVSNYRTSKVDAVYYDVVTVFDTDGLTPVSGQVLGDFAVNFTVDGVASAVAFTLTEIGMSGDYLIVVPGGFPSKGLWAVTTVAAYNGHTWRSHVEVRTYDIDDVYFIVAGGTGVETVTLTFEDSANGNIPIPDMLVQVYDATGVVLITFGRTDNSGVLVLLLNDATYILRMFKPGVSCDEETVIVLDTAGMTPQAFTITCAAVIIAPPASPVVCRLYADFTTMAGLPLFQFKLQVENLYNPESSSGLAVVERSVIYETDNAGHVEFDVVRGARIQVAFVTTKLTREFIVPDKPVESLMTVFGAATDAFQVVKR